MQTVPIFDNDGVNPYAHEVSRIVRSLGGAPKLFFGHVANSTAKLGFLKFLIRSISSEFAIVCWASPRQKICLVVFLMIVRTRLIYVSHNPIASRSPKGIRGRVELNLVKRCINVVHGESLKESFKELYGIDPFVALHPPYSFENVLALKDIEVAQGTRIKKRILIFGRSEKNSDFNLILFASELEKKQLNFELIVAQRPKTNFGDGSNRIINLTSDEHVPQEDLMALITSADLIISPSLNVSESGTVILANSLGVNCVAFYSFELTKHLRPEALPKEGDMEAFVDACFNCLSRTDSQTSNWQKDSWFNECLQTWEIVLDSASRTKGLKNRDLS